MTSENAPDSFECSANLLSCPALPQVPSADASGTLRVVEHALRWSSSSSSSPNSALTAVNLLPRQIVRLQKSPESKPDVKLRVLLSEEKGGPVYVFEFIGSEAVRYRGWVIEWHRREGVLAAAVTGTAPAVAATEISPSSSAGVPAPAPGPAGNVQKRLAQGSAAMRRGFAIGSDPLASFDVRALKESVLTTNAPLRGQYKELVLTTGILTDAEFWDGHKQDLVRAALAKPKVGISSQVPDELRARDAADGTKLVTVDKAMMLAVFQMDHAIKIAFGAFVPLKVTSKAFWVAYVRSDEFRRQRRGVGAAGSASFASSSSASASSLRRANVSLEDIPRMTFTDFFEAHRRGDYDGLTASPQRNNSSTGSSSSSSSSLVGRTAAADAGGGAGGGDGLSSSSSGLDSRLDLVSTVEDSIRASSLREPDARAGYGTGEATRAYDLSELEARALRVRDEDIVGEEGRREQIIHTVNAYSRQVVDAGVETGGGGSGGASFSDWQTGGTNGGAASSTSTSTTTTSTRPAPPTAVAAGRKSGQRPDPSGIGASTANDLTDLYAPQDPSSGMAMLHLDVGRFRAALVAQGGPDPTVVAPRSSGAVGGWTELSADGPPVATSSVARSGPLVGSTPSKRRRSEEPDLAAPAARVAVSADEDVDAPPPKPSPLDAFSKPSAASAKLIMRKLTQSAHDLFSNADRTKGGFSKSVPLEWRTYVGLRFHAIREVQQFLWPTLLSKAAKAPALQERTAKLRGRLNLEFDTLERVKKAVMSKGAFGVLPPSEAMGGDPRDVEVQVVEPDSSTAATATSELVSLLIMLQATLHASLAAAA